MAKIRDYIVPKIPAEWTGNRRTYAVMLQEVLDELHQYVKEDWLSEALRQKINGGNGIKSLVDYSEEVQDTGVLWVDGNSIKQVTQSFTVAADNAMDSNPIDHFGTLIDAKGYVITSSGACYPVGHENLQVWKSGTGDTFKVQSGVGGTAYITVYYTEAEDTPTSDTWEYFRNGYVNDAGGVQIGWSANLLTRPNDMTHGYTVYGLASLANVETDGYMLLYDATGANNYYNSHVCTTNTVSIPADATKLVVEASRSALQSNILLALLPDNAPNTMDASNGGQVSGWISPTTSAALYSMTLEEGIAGSSTNRIIVNYRGKGDQYRAEYITKVYFE